MYLSQQPGPGSAGMALPALGSAGWAQPGSGGQWAGDLGAAGSQRGPLSVWELAGAVNWGIAVQATPRG